MIKPRVALTLAAVVVVSAFAGCGDSKSDAEKNGRQLAQAAEKCGAPKVPIGRSGALTFVDVAGEAKAQLAAAFGAPGSDGKTVAVRRVLEGKTPVGALLVVPIPSGEEDNFKGGFLKQALKSDYKKGAALDVDGMTFDVMQGPAQTIAVGTRKCRGISLFAGSRASLTSVAGKVVPQIK